MIAAPPPPDEENAGGSVGKIAVKDEERTESEGGAVKGEEASKKRKLEALEALHANGTLDEKGEAFSGAFPANKIREALQDGGYASNVRDGAAVYLSAVLEQVTSRLLVRAGTGAPDAPVKADRRIDPKAIQKALTEDSELQRFLAAMAGGGPEPGHREARDVVAGKCIVVDSWDVKVRDAAASALASTLQEIGVAALHAPPPPMASCKALEEAYALNPKAYSVLRLHAGFSAGMSALHAAQMAVLEQEVERLRQRGDGGGGVDSNEEDEDEDEDEDGEDEEEGEEEEEKEDGKEEGSEVGEGKKPEVKKEEEEEEEEKEEEAEEADGGGGEERVTAIVTGSKVWHLATAMASRWRGEMSTDELLLLLDLEQRGGREASWPRVAAEGGGGVGADDKTPFHILLLPQRPWPDAPAASRGGVHVEMWMDAVVIAALRVLSEGSEELTVISAGMEESGGVTGEEIVRELVWREGGAEGGREREREKRGRGREGGKGGREGLVSVRPNLGQFPKAAMVVRADAEVEPALVQMEGRKGGITREGRGGHGVAYVNMGLWGGKGHSNVRWLIVLLMARKVPLCLYSDIGQYVDNFVAYPSHGQKAP